jgi:hypothetical protein
VRYGRMPESKKVRSCRFLGEVWYPDSKSLPESHT